ncbi:hypothetical protein HanHA89_Chr12g0453731 [Helianthus annuus]|nr:hypothetical protein HanHA89_Chr12g0453731 [Helianthus annuus]
MHYSCNGMYTFNSKYYTFLSSLIQRVCNFNQTILNTRYSKYAPTDRTGTTPLRSAAAIDRHHHLHHKTAGERTVATAVIRRSPVHHCRRITGSCRLHRSSERESENRVWV